MPKSKHFLRGGAARIGSVVDFNHVRKFVRVGLLIEHHSPRDSLLRVENDFIPQNLA